MLTKSQTIISWVMQALAAVILLQTLFFKFTAAPESVYIFSKVGAEPWGRLGSGVVELVAALLLLHPKTAVIGAGIALAVITGAIVSHLTILGIALTDVGDKGELFALAITVFVASAIVLFIRRREIPYLGHLLAH